MAKHKRERALFELLSEQRGRQKAKPDKQGRDQGTETPAGPPRPEEPDRRPHRPAPTVVTRKAVIAVGGVRLGPYHLVVIGLAVACLCYLFYLLGARFGGPEDGLPDVPADPSLETIRGEQPADDLVAPEPETPALGHRVAPPPQGREPAPAPRTTEETGRGPGRPGHEAQPTGRTRPPEPEPEPAPTGPQYRVRIARLDVSRPDAIDALRAYLARSGIETDLVTRGGYHVLYSRKRFDEKTDSDRLADQANKSLAAFEAETGRPTSKDAYTVQVERE